MQQTGIYEQLITQLIERRLDRERFYVGERELSAGEASVWLSRFLATILDYAIGSVPSGEDQLQKQIELANELLLWLKSTSKMATLLKIIYSPAKEKFSLRFMHLKTLSRPILSNMLRIFFLSLG